MIDMMHDVVKCDVNKTLRHSTSRCWRNIIFNTLCQISTNALLEKKVRPSFWVGPIYLSATVLFFIYFILFYFLNVCAFSSSLPVLVLNIITFSE